jgi:hypothetical protein
MESEPSQPFILEKIVLGLTASRPGLVSLQDLFFLIGAMLDEITAVRRTGNFSCSQSSTALGA